MGIPYLPHSKCHSQEQESRCNLAISYLAILIVHLTRFSVPLHLRPRVGLSRTKLTGATTIASYSGADGGKSAYGPLIQASDGNLYGTFYDGGTPKIQCGGAPYYGCGSAFRITPDGVVSTLVEFDFNNQLVSPDGIRPRAGLLQGRDGGLYGSTWSGGYHGSGTVFRLDLGSSPPPSSSSSQPSATTPEDATLTPTCSSSSKGMCVANAHTMLTSLNLNDTPEGYTTPIGSSPAVRLSYSHKEAGQPTTFNYFNVGQKWTLNVLSFIQDNPASAGQSVTRTVGGGGFFTQTGYNSSSGAFAAEQQTQAILTRIPATGAVTRYELAFPDGSIHKFEKLDGGTASPRRVFLTKMIDPQGNALTLNYDAQNRLTSLTDATGKNTTLSYGSSNPLLVTKITDPFGRAASLGYDGSGRLSAIIDVLGIASSFTYDTTDPTFIRTMTTPYGTSSFAGAEDKVANTRWLELTDPLGKTERLEFRANAPGIAANPANVPAGISVASGSFAQYNSFYWDKHVKEAVGSTDYTKATLTHWLTNSAGQTSPIISSTKAPLENPLYFNYAGQAQPIQAGATDQPSVLGQMLDSGTSQLAQSSYNSVGNPTSMTDSVGRVTLLGYAANGVDLISRQQKTSPTAASQICPRNIRTQRGKCGN
jgi:YD repeat-containing protein